MLQTASYCTACTMSGRGTGYGTDGVQRARCRSDDRTRLAFRMDKTEAHRQGVVFVYVLRGSRTACLS